MHFEIHSQSFNKTEYGHIEFKFHFGLRYEAAVPKKKKKCVNCE